MGNEYEIKNIPKKGTKNQHKTTTVFFDMTLFLNPHSSNDKIINVIKHLTKFCEFRNKFNIYDIDAHPSGGVNQVPDSKLSNIRTNTI